MMRKLVCFFLVLIAVAAGCFFWLAPEYVDGKRNPVLAHDPYPVSEVAKKLHNDMIIGDWHADSLLWKRNLLQRNSNGHVDFERLAEGNVAIQVFTAVTKSPRGQNYELNSDDAPDNITLLAVGQLWPVRTWSSLLERALYQADKFKKFESNAPQQVKLIRTASDMENLLEKRKTNKQLIGGILGVEGAHVLEGNIENLILLMDAGYRLIGLHHFFDNKLGGSLHGTAGQGLTEFGREVVREIVNRNLILDVAHSSAKVTRDVLAMTDIPIVLSHTGIHSHCKTKRNYSDDLMREIAATGGVIGIGYWADAICDPSPNGVALAIKAAIETVGEDHVSLGSDFDGAVATSFDASELGSLTQAMIDAGLSEVQIRKVMGENMLRVLRARLDK